MHEKQTTGIESERHGVRALDVYWEPPSYGFDLDDEEEIRDLRTLRPRHMVGAANVQGGRDPFVVEDRGRILYGATVTRPPGFDLTYDDLPETSSVSKRSQRPTGIDTLGLAAFWPRIAMEVAA